jgi:hypothetical protein
MSRDKRRPDAGRGAPAPSPIAASPESKNRLRVTLTAELLEDTHLGAGTGGPGVNALLARDRRGDPVIWASHLEGLLRAKAREVLADAQVVTLFGGPGGTQQPLVFTSLYCDAPAPCRIWRSTARESYDNRAPAADTLRAVEHVARGTRFTGMVELPSDLLRELERLLIMLDAIGHGRSTGAGKVRFGLDLSPTPRPSQRRPRQGTSSLRLLLRNRDPLCVAATATPGNLIPTESFIPGRTLLGALAKWLLDEGLRDAASLLVSERISVSDALPLPEVKELNSDELSALEVLPAPLALKTPKPRGHHGDSPWWHRSDPPASWVLPAETQDQPEKLKRAPDDLHLLRLGDAPWCAYRPVTRVRLRNGRPNPERLDPLLFAIEQIAEETRFLAELQGEAAELQTVLEALRPVLEARRWIRVGRAGAPVEVLLTAEPLPRRPPSESPCYLTLTSDLLARDELLRWRTGLEAKDFSALAGWPTQPIEVERIEQGQVHVHGFNGTARLWRMPAVAIRRGSVFRISGPGVASLAEAIASGRWLGERTHEGFGRFRLDVELPSTPLPDLATTTPRRASPVQDADEEELCRVTHQWFDAHRELSEVGSSRDRRPSLSQWIDLVHDLRGPHGDSALARRMEPRTAGATRWLQSSAAAVLTKLKSIQGSARQAAHAEMFTRWLRAAIRDQRDMQNATSGPGISEVK